MNLRIHTFVAPGFAENTYVLRADDMDEAVIIDPGNCVDEVLALLRGERLGARHILLTHAHIDHIEGVAPLVRALGAQVHLHPDDMFLYERAPLQAQQFGMSMETPPPPDHPLADGDRLELAGISFDVRHAPGHAPGHVILHVPAAGCAFVGDVIFLGSIGRTDLPGGDFAQLIASIRTQVFALPDETVLYNGHGPHTTVAHERATNPFLRPSYGGGLA
jgi:hydroxyacylglutathione hydrolase